MPAPTLHAPSHDHLHRQIAMYTVELCDGLRTIDMMVVAVGATSALIQAEALAYLATGRAYRRTGRFDLAAIH